MLERFYYLKCYKVFKLAPTGVAANNINDQTLHRFFGMSNSDDIVNMNRLDENVKLYTNMVFLVDEFSMVSNSLLETLNRALIKTTNRSVPMGGIRTVFFGDFAQLCPVLPGLNEKQKDLEMLWNSSIYNHSLRLNLVDPIRQADERFLKVLNFVRSGNFNKVVVEFINAHSVLKSDLPVNCLRLYPTVNLANFAN
jgi:ATP-dependent DNA helicase PIF1